MSLQKQAIDGARAGILPQLKKGRKEELIDERLKLQEAKKLGIEVTDDESSACCRAWPNATR